MSSFPSNSIKNEYSIDFTLDYDYPIEVSEFTKALNAFSSEYKKFINDTYGSEQPVEAKLHIEKIQEGSILTTFVEYSYIAIPFLTNINTVLEFGNYLKAAYKYFGKTGNEDNDKDFKYDLKDLDNLTSIIAPGTNYGAHTTIIVKGEGHTLNVLNVNDTQASALTHHIDKEKKSLDKSDSNIHKKQLFYFDQAKKNIDSKTGNYGIIEGLYPQKLRVIFEDDKSDKKRMLMGSINPLKASFIVDVEVQTKRGEPTTYKILQLHEIIPDDI